VHLVRAIQATCPSQDIDDYTPDAWYPAVADMDFEDCLAAVGALSKWLRYIAVCDVVEEVEAIRNDRRARVPREQLLPETDPDNVLEYRAELAKLVRDAGARRGAVLVSPLQELTP
jgi:hypothetical protein